MSGLNLRERAEDADKALIEFKAGLTADASAEEITRLGQLAAEVMDAWNAFNADQEATAARNGANAQRLGPGGLPLEDAQDGLEGESGIAKPNGMTLAQAFVKSPAYQEVMAGSYGRAFQFAAPLASAAKAEFGFRDNAQNALIWTGDPETLGVVDRPARLPGIVDPIPYQSRSIRSLCTNLTTDATSVEWVRILSKTYGSAVVEEAKSELPIGDGTGGTVVVADSGIKPTMDFALEIEQTTTKTIAVLSYITVRQAKSPSEMLAMLRTLMLEDVRRTEDDEILNGTGGATSLDGLLSAKWGIAATAATGTSIEKILGMVGEIANTGFYPTAIVMNPTDWHSDAFLLATNANGDFILADPTRSIDQLNVLWGLQVVTNQSVAAGQAIVGDFRQVRIWDRMQSSVEVSKENRDLFERNILTLRAEEELALGVVAPEAFRKIQA